MVDSLLLFVLFLILVMTYFFPYLMVGLLLAWGIYHIFRYATRDDYYD